MSKVIKMVSSLPFVKGMDVPPCPVPEAGVIDVSRLSLVTDPAAARYDARIDESLEGVTEGLLKLGMSLKAEKQIVSITLAWLRQRVHYEDGTTEDVWALEPLDGRRRTCASIAAKIKTVKYSLYEDAHLLPDWRLNELAVKANTERLQYTPEQIAQKAPGMVQARLAELKGKPTKAQKEEVHEKVAAILNVSTANLKLIMESWEKMSASVKEEIESGAASVTIIRDLASVPVEAQETVLAVAKEIEKETVAIQDAEGKGGKRSSGEVSTDAIRAAKAALSGQALPESAQRSEARTAATEKVTAKLGLSTGPKTGAVGKAEREAAIAALQGWRTGPGLAHADAGKVALILAVLEWVADGESKGALESVADGMIVKLMRAMR